MARSGTGGATFTAAGRVRDLRANRDAGILDVVGNEGIQRGGSMTARELVPVAMRITGIVFAVGMFVWAWIYEVRYL